MPEITWMVYFYQRESRRINPVTLSIMDEGI